MPWLITVQEVGKTADAIAKALALPEGADEREPDLVAVIAGDETNVSDAADALLYVQALARGEMVESTYVDLWIDRRPEDD